MAKSPRSKKRKPVFLEPTTHKGREVQRRAFDFLSLKRRHKMISATEAAKRSGTTLKSVRKYAGAALELKDARWNVRQTDRIPRDMLFLEPKGYISLHVSNSRDATRIAKYHNALRRYLLRRELRELQEYVGKSIRIRGIDYPFLTDPAIINRLVRGGAVNFLDIYGAPGGGL